MAIRIEDGRVVTLSYRLLDTDGRLIEEKTPDEPYIYIQGRGQIVAAVERALKGKTAGHAAEVSLSPRDAYGDYDPGLVAELALDGFPQEVAVGMKFNTKGPDGNAITIRVLEIEDDVVTVDGNHPLAGLELIFELRVLDVREASERELDAGLADAPILSSDESDGGDTLH